MTAMLSRPQYDLPTVPEIDIESALAATIRRVQKHIGSAREKVFATDCQAQIAKAREKAARCQARSDVLADEERALRIVVEKMLRLRAKTNGAMGGDRWTAAQERALAGQRHALHALTLQRGRFAQASGSWTT